MKYIYLTWLFLNYLENYKKIISVIIKSICFFCKKVTDNSLKLIVIVSLIVISSHVCKNPCIYSDPLTISSHAHAHYIFIFPTKEVMSIQSI